MKKIKSVERARALVEVYNRETAQIEKLERRLVVLHEKHRKTRNAAFSALPDNAGISMGDQAWEVEEF